MTAGVADPRPAHPRGRLPAADRTGAAREPRRTFAPRPGAAPLPRQVAAQAVDGDAAAAAQRRAAAARRGHPGDRADRRGRRRRRRRPRPSRTRRRRVHPGVLALAVMSTAFTSLAIATGFERRYGVHQAARHLPAARARACSPARPARCCSSSCSRSSSSARSGSPSGWDPDPTWSATLLAVAARHRRLRRPWACSSPASLRAEATLAAANLVYLLLLAGGAVVLPASAYGAFGDVVRVAAVRRPRRRDARRPGARDPSPGRDLAVLLGVGRARRRARPRGRSSGSEQRVTCTSAPLAWATLVANCVLVVTGGAVRLTGSGLGCPTWPRCTERVVHAARRARPARGDRVRQPDAHVRAGRDRGGDVRRRLADRPPRPAAPGARSSRWASRPRRSSAASPC